MSRVITIVWILLTLIGAGMVTAQPSHAQAQVRLDAIEPSEGLPGQELSLTLLGGGFRDAPEVRVFVGEFEVLGVEVLSDERILARVYIPEDAPPGPHPVEVVAVFGENEEIWAGLEAGFWVREPERLPPGIESPPEPPLDPPGPPPERPDEPPRVLAQVDLRAVEPSEGLPGQRLELTLIGNGFPGDCVRCQPQVVIGGFEVQDVRVETNERIVVQVQIPEDAPPGSRTVEVHFFLEGRELASAQLAAGFVVLEPVSARPPRTQGPEPPPDDGDGLVIFVVILVMGVVGFSVRRYIRVQRLPTPEKKPVEEPAAPLPEFHFEVGMDPGRQSIETPGQGLTMDIEIRLVTSIDYGEQSVEVKGGSITG